MHLRDRTKKKKKILSEGTVAVLLPIVGVSDVFQRDGWVDRQSLAGKPSC